MRSPAAITAALQHLAVRWEPTIGSPGRSV